MINDIIVIDDVIPKQYQNDIEDLLLGDTAFPWFLVKDVTYVQEKIKFAGINQNNPAFCHIFYSFEKSHVSEFFNFIKPMAYYACDKLGYDLTEILTCRSFLQIPDKGNVDPNHPHVDLDFDHLVFLYYVNDNEAPTNIFKQRSEDVKLHDVISTNFDLVSQVLPKKGRCVMFNGRHYHSSSSPNENLRCIINFDLR